MTSPTATDQSWVLILILFVIFVLFVGRRKPKKSRKANSPKRIKLKTSPLIDKNGQKFSENDHQWRALSVDSFEHAANREWGLYRNCELKKGELLMKERRHKYALEYFLWVMFIDQALFEKNDRFFAPKVLEWALKMASHLKMDMASIETAYYKSVSKHAISFPSSLKISAQQGWRIITNAIKSEIT